MRRIGILGMALVLSANAVSAQARSSLPEGVTPAMVSTGETLYKSIGLCFACHGPDARGVPGAGVNLTDDEWLHVDATFEGLVQRILDGVGPDLTETGLIMLPKGGSQVTGEQIRAIASYVWSLGQVAEATRDARN